MQQNKINILSTRPLDQMIIDEANNKNILISCVSFIETEMILNEQLKKEILALAQLDLAIVFTSMNAVESVAKHLNNIQPNWKIFCIGSTTKKLVEEYFKESKILGNADSASTLADDIISEKNVESVVFFCGDQRRDELPEKLLKQNIELKEIVVYKTIEVAYKIDNDFDGIIFYSPSAVQSFFSFNKINPFIILFSIGNTTAETIKKYSSNKIIIAKEPSKKLLAEQAINYFESNPIHY